MHWRDPQEVAERAAKLSDRFGHPLRPTFETIIAKIELDQIDQRRMDVHPQGRHALSRRARRHGTRRCAWKSERLPRVFPGHQRTRKITRPNAKSSCSNCARRWRTSRRCPASSHLRLVQKHPFGHGLLAEASRNMSAPTSGANFSHSICSKLPGENRERNRRSREQNIKSAADVNGGRCRGRESGENCGVAVCGMILRLWCLRWQKRRSEISQLRSGWSPAVKFVRPERTMEFRRAIQDGFGLVR